MLTSAGRHFAALALAAVLVTATAITEANTLDITTATIADVQAAFASGHLTSEKLTRLYLERIEAYDKQGPAINAVITLNPQALQIAKALDKERKSKGPRGPLHGIPIILKDNYDTFDLPTTAGSQLLQGSIPPDDAFVVKKLRDAGVIIVAKVNLHEFAMGGGAPNGFSSLGGQTHNPHDLARGPAGSSGGTGAGIAAAFAQFGLGTDTGGSVRNPSSANGIVGLKPTRGLMSRDGIVPLALSFDTGGPMARSVYDIAVSLGVMTGVDAADPATQASAGHFATDYTQYLKTDSLRGARIGVARDFFKQSEATDRVMEAAIAKLRQRGAIIMDPIVLPDYLVKGKAGLSQMIMATEFKAQIADYLATLKPGYPHNLAELVAKAKDPATQYASPWKRDSMEQVQLTALSIDDPVYIAAKTHGLALITATIEGVFADHQLDALIYPTVPRPASLIESSEGRGGMDSATNIANQTGFPDLIVPAGMTTDGLPVTISFLGLAWSEPKLLGYGYDFEQASKARVLPKFTPAFKSDVVNY
jgi:amidase